MARISTSAISTSQINVVISGLENPANSYSSFHADVYQNGNFIKKTSGSTASSGTSYTLRVTGLLAGKEYYLDVYATRNGAQYYIDTGVATTYPASDPPDTPKNFRVTSVTSSSISLAWSSVSGSGVVYEIEGDGRIYEVSGTSYTFNNLQSNTSYTFYLYAYRLGIYSDGTSVTGRTSTPDTIPPTISTTAYAEKTSTGYVIHANWSAYDAGGISHFWVYISGPDNTILTSIGYDYWGDERSYTFYADGNGNAFIEGKRYMVRIRAVDYAGNLSTPVTAGDAYVTIQSARPPNWAWEYSIYSGGPFYSQSGKTAYLMRAAHWNEFTARISAFRKYKGYTTYWFSTATTALSSADLRVCVSQAVIAINEMLPTGKMPSVGMGTTVAASIFINMRDKLNSIT